MRRTGDGWSVSSLTAWRMLGQGARAKAGKSSTILPSTPGAPCLAFTWGQALRRFSGVSPRSTSSSLTAGAIARRRQAVPCFRSVLVESVLPPPCPPCLVLRSPPGEQDDSYSDRCGLLCQGQRGLRSRSVSFRGPPRPRTRQSSPRIRP